MNKGIRVLSSIHKAYMKSNTGCSDANACHKQPCKMNLQQRKRQKTLKEMAVNSGQLLTTHEGLYLFPQQFLDEVVGFAPLVNNEKDIADINTNTTLQVVVKGNVARHSFPVAIESQAEEFAPAIEHW